MKSFRSIALFAVLFSIALAAFAQTVTSQPVAVPAPESPAATYTSIAFAVLGSLFGIWRNKQASTARKVTETLVIAIEQATQLPQVQEHEQRIKANIREAATKAGVEPVLNVIVRNLT